MRTSPSPNVSGYRGTAWAASSMTDNAVDLVDHNPGHPPSLEKGPGIAMIMSNGVLH